MHRTSRAAAAALALLIFTFPTPTLAQGGAAHLTVYDAGIAEFLEERTIELQPGINAVEWRSLMPKAFIRTVRVTAEDAVVVRQDVTYDGAEVRNERAPVLHIVVRNTGAAGPRKIQVDYLAPGLDWHDDYTLLLDATPDAAPPTGATLDSWVSVQNQTGADLRAGTVDLVAGEISLLLGGQQYRSYDELARANTAQMADGISESTEIVTSAESSGLSAFSRFRLGRNLSMNSNAPINRFPLFQRARLKITQRLVFENEYGTQTLARGGFVLLPRGLEVRLISQNPTDASMPAGQVTIYARDGAISQVVGQDTIPLTPPGGEFTVTQGRSATVFGTRRVLERRSTSYKDERDYTRDKLTTRVEVVITNRGSRAVEAFVREGIEPANENRWTILESTVPTEKLSANTFQMKVQVPAGGKTTVSYTVETR
ncbi:MAG TPA: hypothetical protein VFS10_20875 [Pyrinomonadaceae bacterium]|nr:hypothetical protein [Pyrinomonadaceae bacterium]